MKRNCMLKMVPVLLAVTLMLSGIALAGEYVDETLEVTLAQYVEAYVGNSDAVKAAREDAENAQTQWQRAVDEKKAALTVKELENAAETKRLALDEAVNNAALQAVQAYVGLGQALRELEAKRVSLAVSQERLRVTHLRYEAGLTTKDAVLEQENSYLSASDSLLKAEQSLRQTKRSFCQNIGAELCDDIVLATDVSTLYGDVPEYGLNDSIEAAQGVGSSYFSAAAGKELARRKCEALQDPLIATPTERETAEKSWKDAETRFASAEQSLIDSIENALVELESLVRNLNMQTISAQRAQSNLEVARIKFQHGEMLQYELDNETSSANQALYRMAKAKEDLFVHMLKLESLIGGSVLDIVMSKK